MKTPETLFTIAATTFGILTAMTALFSPGAIASNYSAGKTTLNIQERGDNHPGGYSTEIQGRKWVGNLNILRANGGVGSFRYSGTFEDYPINKRGIKCTGNIALVRQSVGRSTNLAMYATWEVKGGTGCPSIGKTFTVSLSEALPRANSKGDYTEPWGKWRVISADGALSCREKPNGKIVRVLKTNDIIFLDGRLGNTISFSNGDAWLYTPYIGESYSQNNYKPCYVRASSSYITPSSLPF